MNQDFKCRSQMWGICSRYLKWKKFKEESFSFFKSYWQKFLPQIASKIIKFKNLFSKFLSKLTIRKYYLGKIVEYWSIPAPPHKKKKKKKKKTPLFKAVANTRFFSTMC